MVDSPCVASGDAIACNGPPAAYAIEETTLATARVRNGTPQGDVNGTPTFARR